MPQDNTPTKPDSPPSPPLTSPIRHASVARRNACRLAAIQTLYQHRFASSDSLPTETLAETAKQYETHFLPDLLAELGLPHLAKDMSASHYQRLVAGVAGQQETLDGLIAEYLRDGWRLERLPAIEWDTLRVAVFELRAMAEIPGRAIIAEYAAIAAEAWDSDATYITALLDKIAHASRPEEMAGG